MQKLRETFLGEFFLGQSEESFGTCLVRKAIRKTRLTKANSESGVLI